MPTEVIVRWIIVTTILAGIAGVVLYMRARSARGRFDAGAVSDRWIAEHRVDELPQ